MASKQRYSVYVKRELYDDDGIKTVEYDWTPAGETVAVSEAQAINNVRHRVIGRRSQYGPYEVGPRWSVWLRWSARVVE